MNQIPPHAESSVEVEMPRPTAAPLVLAVGIVLLSLGLATSLFFIPIGGLLCVYGLTMWVGQLLPGRGHQLESVVPISQRSIELATDAGRVEKLRQGMPGYRLRLPVKVHPVSAGIKGGIVGGLVMPLPALAYGVLSGHGIWWPVNLMAGMVLPGMENLSTAELEQFRPTFLIIGIAIHAIVSLILGLMYGVLMPTLPNIPKPLAWGALLMPLLWTAVSFIVMGQVNPAVRGLIEWPWFVVSQLVFGIVAALVYMQLRPRGAIKAGILGGLAGGLLMPVPAILWSLAVGHGLWYPVNVLSAMVLHHDTTLPPAALESFRGDWFAAALVIHLMLSVLFGLAFAIVLPRMPSIPGPLAWGGMLLPLLWTGASYGLMGIMNPLLQEQVHWPWFIVSQFIFGIVAAIVVVRSEQVHIPPAGQGGDWMPEEVAAP